MWEVILRLYYLSYVDMDLFNLVNNIFSSVFPIPTPSESATPMHPSLDVKDKPRPSDLDREIATLEECMGALSNRTLTITLQELNTIIPRKRIRIDAYAKLNRHLKATRNANLNIISRKSS